MNGLLLQADMTECNGCSEVKQEGGVVLQGDSSNVPLAIGHINRHMLILLHTPS